MMFWPPPQQRGYIYVFKSLVYVRMKQIKQCQFWRGESFVFRERQVFLIFVPGSSAVPADSARALAAKKSTLHAVDGLTNLRQLSR